MSSTTRSMYATSLGISTSRETRSPASGGRDAAMWGNGGGAGWGTSRQRRRCAGPPEGGPREESEARERAVARIRDLEQRVELGELEQGLQIVVEVGEPQLPALLTDL